MQPTYRTIIKSHNVIDIVLHISMDYRQQKKIILFYYNSQPRNEAIAPKKLNFENHSDPNTFVLQIISKDSRTYV
jgi:hypothetical protein